MWCSFCDRDGMGLSHCHHCGRGACYDGPISQDEKTVITPAPTMFLLSVCVSCRKKFIQDVGQNRAACTDCYDHEKSVWKNPPKERKDGKV